MPLQFGHPFLLYVILFLSSLRPKALDGGTKLLYIRSKLTDAHTKPCEDATIAYRKH